MAQGERADRAEALAAKLQTRVIYLQKVIEGSHAVKRAKKAGK
jgi:hypothetical protein